MKLKYSLTALLVVAVVLLGGCSLNQNSSELLHPPKTTGNEAEIEQLIESTAKDSYTLKYPRSGEYRSAIVTNDFDKDGNDEAIAFYRTNNSTTNMLIMRDTKDGYKICCNYEAQYTDIDCLQFADYDFDGVDEILVGFVTYTSGVNELVVFDYNSDKGSAEAIELSTKYSSFTTGDYDRDGSKEIMLVALASADTKAKATLIDYDKNQLYKQSSCSLDSNVTKIENVQSDFIEDGIMAVVVDGFISETYNTQVIVFNDSKLQIEVCATTKERTQSIKSCDIDDDGFVEIPEISSSPMPKKADTKVATPMITWYGYSGEDSSTAFVPNVYSFGNFEYSYSFILPEKMAQSTMAVTSADSKTMKIYHLNNNKQGDLILTFKVFDSDSTSNKGSNYTTLRSINRLDYCYSISDTAYMDDDTVKENFTPFS